MLLLLLACSGGLEKFGDDTAGYNLETDTSPGETGPIDSAGDGNSGPTANAGSDQEVNTGDVVGLDGSASSDPDGDALDFLWEITDRPSGSAAALINSTFADPQFIPDVGGVFELSLVVSDGSLDSAPDTVRVTAADVNGLPVADAGPDQTVAVGATVYLDGTGSTDSDGDALLFGWTMVSRPGGSAAALSGSTTGAPTFVADIAGTYEVSLTVSDGDDYSNADSVRVTASSGDTGGTSGGCGCRTGTSQEALGTVLLVGLALLFRPRP